MQNMQSLLRRVHEAIEMFIGPHNSLLLSSHLGMFLTSYEGLDCLIVLRSTQS